MLRRRREEEPDLTHRWLVSYADFITLLFAFFVVMYSISQVNEGKYRILSDSLLTAFSPPTTKTSEDTATSPTGGANALGALDQSGETLLQSAGADQESISLPKDAPPTEREQREFAQLYSDITASLKSLIEADLVEVRGSEDWIEVDVRSGLLFESGSDVLGSAADPVIRELAENLRNGANLLRVRGYTDDQPIETDRFPSNWELSAARAVAVVRKLQAFGVTPARLAVEGFGQYNPIAGNTEETGRARNRRVVIAISRFQALNKPDAATTAPAESTASPAAGKVSEPAEQVDVVRLPDGGLLIRGKTSPTTPGNNPPATPPTSPPASPPKN